MRTFVLLAALVSLVPDRPDPTPREKPPKAIQEALVGDWQLVKSLVAGKDEGTAGKQGTTIVSFSATELHVMENGKRQSSDDASYFVDATKKPATIDIVPKRDGDTKIEGILRVEGDQLILCFAHGGLGPRPLDFGSAPDTQNALMYLKRVKR